MTANKKLLLAALIGALAIAVVVPAAAVAVPVYSTKWGTAGAGNGEFSNPGGVAADGLGNVYVADYGNDRVQKFNSTGGYLAQWPAGNGPEGIAVGRYWNAVYLAVWFDNAVTIRTPTGTVFVTVGTGTGGTGPGQFNSPEGVAIDRFGFIYVSDSGNDRIQKFYPNGTFMMQWGSTGASPGQFNKPYGIAVDPLGNVYVADWNNDRVQKFTSTGGFLGQWGGTGTADGKMDAPTDVNVGQDGNIYVSEQTNNRVQAFSPSGGFLFKFGGPGATDGLFNEAWGVSSDGTGIYVVDRANNRIQKFSLSVAKQTLRIGGGDRYEVAVNLAARRWPGYVGIKDVLVVCGEDRANADPLASSGLAGVYDAPVLMTKTTGLPTSTKNALKSMKSVNGTLNIHVIGGSKSIPTSVYNAIKATNSGGTIERISGADRYALSVNMAVRLKQVADSKGIPVPAVLIFNGQNSNAFYDALAAGPLSAGGQVPMLAVRTNGVPSEVNNALNTTFVGKPRLVVNSTTYVPASIYTATGSTFRLSNTTNRYLSASQISSWGRLAGWTGLKNVGIVNKLPDALTGGSFLGQEGGVLLYTSYGSFPSESSNAVSIFKIGSQEGYVFGGPKSVSSNAIASFNTVLNTP
jgi:sugar lactone lactonase YvrE